MKSQKSKFYNAAYRKFKKLNCHKSGGKLRKIYTVSQKVAHYI